MNAFSITFRNGTKLYEADVVKYYSDPIRYEVFNVIPYNRNLPTRFTFISNAILDQLISQSFNEHNRELLTNIGEAIFKTCQLLKIPVHQ